MDRLNATIDAVNSFAWGPPMLGILGVTGVLLTLGLVFMPWRKVGYGFGLLFEKGEATGEGEIKPFNALMTALSATVGTGNIAGVATAIALALGGPGAIFYMWLIALFGMATKYAEAVCAVTYREVDAIDGFERAMRLRTDAWEEIALSDDEEASASVSMILALS